MSTASYPLLAHSTAIPDSEVIYSHKRNCDLSDALLQPNDLGKYPDKLIETPYIRASNQARPSRTIAKIMSNNKPSRR